MCIVGIVLLPFGVGTWFCFSCHSENIFENVNNQKCSEHYLILIHTNGCGGCYEGTKLVYSAKVAITLLEYCVF